MSTTRPDDTIVIPGYFQKEERLQKDQFFPKFRNALKKIHLQNYPEQCHSVIVDKVAEQAWYNYLSVCDFIDKNKIVEGHIKGVSKKIRNDLDQLYFQNRCLGPRIGCCEYILNEDILKKTETYTAEEEKNCLTTVNTPIYYFNLKDTNAAVEADLTLINYSNHLLLFLASSMHRFVIAMINFGVNINQYSPIEGNTPILLAVSKGWNHQNSKEESPNKSTIYQQREIITSLLDNGADVNAAHLSNGMTPLHIACLRGDDPELITLLVEKGAKWETKDYTGRTPLELLNFNYESTQHMIAKLTNSYRSEEPWVFGQSKAENQSETATLPTRQQRRENQAKILKHFSKSNSSLLSIMTAPVELSASELSMFNFSSSSSSSQPQTHKQENCDDKETLGA